MQRREFLLSSAAFGLAACWRQGPSPATPWFKMSLAQWSLHRAFFGGTLDAMDFARISKRDYGIDAIEYVNQFYAKNWSPDVANQLKARADSEGVRSVLIMCDGEGQLGDPDTTARDKAVANHYKWLDAASVLGCHSIRVNAASGGTYDEQMALAADGLRKLTERAAAQNLNVIVENHGGLSSNGAWLTAVIRRANHPRLGTLPDFGNFREYDRYRGVEEMMPFAKDVSAKSHEFDASGNETQTDYARMLRIVKDSGYRGYLGIEYEGDKLSEPDGIRATKALLERYLYM